jgi:enoyl-CoA hydratase/carnithine racemase
MLALAHDFRVMRPDRGFFCLPEVDLAMKRGFSDGMTAVLRARLPAVTLHEAVVTGRRYGGAEAVTRGIFDEAVGEERVLPRAIEWARAMAGKDPETVRALERGIHRDALAVLERPGPHPL